MKIVINTHIGFSLSEKAMLRYGELKGWNIIPVLNSGRMTYYRDEIEEGNYVSHRDFERTDPILIQVVEELGVESNGKHAKLKVVEVPDDVKWELVESEHGSESIHEVHRVWQ